MGKIITYKHHGVEVKVDEDLKGRHREHCLCWKCKHFHPRRRRYNCPKANIVYNCCQLFNLTLPVWECQDFEERDD